MQLSDKYPFLINYFNEAKKNNNYAAFQSLLFYGADTNAQYKIALYLAKMLNCEEDFNENCNCKNCRWIDFNEHPAVSTVSRIDFKDQNDETKRVISVKQAQRIKNSLSNTSNYHRVYIFCDKGEDGEILGVNSFNFQTETANALLKVIEEPPQKTTFIFLTEDKNDVLQTIQSRCMSFFVPSFKKEDYDYSLIENVFTDYLEFNRQNAFEIANSLFELSKDNSPIQILENIQSYILILMKTNINNKSLSIRLINDLKEVEQAKKQVILNMNIQNIFDNLCLKIIK